MRIFFVTIIVNRIVQPGTAKDELHRNISDIFQNHFVRNTGLIDQIICVC